MDLTWSPANGDRLRRPRRTSERARGRRGHVCAHRQAQYARSTPSPPCWKSARCPRRGDRRPDARRASRSARSPACRSRSRTCSTSRACRRSPARKINREHPPAERDAPLIERLEAAGAVLVGALNMGEYAYDFTGENVHDGAVAQSARPHAHDRRLVRRLAARGRRRARAAVARLRHQRLDPRAAPRSAASSG